MKFLLKQKHRNFYLLSFIFYLFYSPLGGDDTMGKKFRVNRVAEEIKKVISLMLINELKDPRIASMTSITGVDVTDDYSYATVYLSVFGSDEEKENTLLAVKNAAGFIRKEVGKQIQMRHTPEILFKMDNSIEYGMHIDKLIYEIGKDNKNNHEE